MTYLSEFVDRFKREVAPLGRFSELNPEVFDEDIAAALADAFGEAQLAGLFSKHQIDTQGEVYPDLSPRGAAVVLAYAGARHLRSQLVHVQTRAKYQAGPVLYETEQSVNLLRDLLKDATQRLADLVALEAASKRERLLVSVTDGYLVRALGLP